MALIHFKCFSLSALEHVILENLYVAWNEETRLTAPKTKFEFFDDFERQKHALSNGPM